MRKQTQMLNAKCQMNSGQSLFEVIFAIAIIALLITGIVSLSAKSIRNSDFSQNNAIATKYSQEGMEWIRKYRDSGWANFKSHSSAGGSRWCINTLPSPPSWASSSSCGTGKISGTVFSREIVITDDSVNPNIVNVAVEVNWNDSQGTHTVKSVSTLTQWKI